MLQGSESGHAVRKPHTGPQAGPYPDTRYPRVGSGTRREPSGSVRPPPRPFDMTANIGGPADGPANAAAAPDRPRTGVEHPSVFGPDPDGTRAVDGDGPEG